MSPALDLIRAGKAVYYVLFILNFKLRSGRFPVPYTKCTKERGGGRGGKKSNYQYA